MRTTALIVEPTPYDERDTETRGNQLVRTDFQRERDMEYEARMYLSGKTMAEIAEKLGISAGTVGRDIAAIRQEWQELRVADMNAALNIELAKIDALEQTYWQAWYDSQKRIVKRKSTTDNQNQYRMNGQYGASETPRRVKSRQVDIETPNTGNPAFLSGVERCIDRRIKLLGLDAAPKQAISTAPGDGSKANEPVTDAVRVAIILDEFRRAREIGRGDDADRTRIIDGVATASGEGGI